MERVVNSLRGSVRVELSGAPAERLINMCAFGSIAFWDTEKLSPETVRLTVHRSDLKRLYAALTPRGVSVDTVARRGAPFFLRSLRGRAVLLIGLAAALLAAWALSFFIWDIEVYGNDAVSDEEILKTLEELGVGVGSFGLSLESEQLANRMLLRIPELSWFAINVSGSRARVLVRERVDRAEIVDREQPTMVCAGKSGLITKLCVLDGTPVTAVGETVTRGQVLVTGITPSLTSGKRAEHAMADVTARTWYDLSAQMVLGCAGKEYTGAEKVRTALIICGKRINLFLNSRISYGSYDKIIEKKELTLPGGHYLPVTVVRERYSEYTETGISTARYAAETILKDRLTQELSGMIDGEVLSLGFETEEKDGVLTVTMHAECLEQIGVVRPMTEEELGGLTEDETGT